MKAISGISMKSSLDDSYAKVQRASHARLLRCAIESFQKKISQDWGCSIQNYQQSRCWWTIFFENNKAFALVYYPQRFSDRFSMYQINRLFIIQYYSQLRIGGCNEKGEFSLPTIKRKEDACSLAQGLCIFEKWSKR